MSTSAMQGGHKKQVMSFKMDPSFDHFWLHLWLHVSNGKILLFIPDALAPSLTPFDIN